MTMIIKVTIITTLIIHLVKGCVTLSTLIVWNASKHYTLPAKYSQAELGKMLASRPLNKVIRI